MTVGKGAVDRLGPTSAGTEQVKVNQPQHSGLFLTEEFVVAQIQLDQQRKISDLWSNETCEPCGTRGFVGSIPLRGRIILQHSRSISTAARVPGQKT